MALSTARFPSCVSFGAVSGPVFSTVRTVVASGHDDVVIRYEQPLHRYTFEHANRTQTEHDELLEFFMAVKGMGHRFPVKDHTDYICLAADGVLQGLHAGLTVGTAGLGFGTIGYVLQKKYTVGGLTTYRNIHKPLSGFVVYRGGSPVTFGASPGNIAVDSASGKISFVADQNRGISTHTVGADHLLVLASAFSPNVSIGQRVYITGVTGSAATILNDLSHEVTNVSSANVTIATATTGLTATGGVAFLYPQASETLTWAGEFDVICRFLSDEASFEIVDRAGEQGLLYSWSGINLTEVRVAMT